MRVSSLAIAAALTLASLSASLSWQRPDDEIDPRSVALVAQARVSAKGMENIRALPPVLLMDED